MRVLVEGSGGSAGWPEPGCRCASCLRQAAAGNTRERSTIVVDGRLRLGAGTEAGEAGTGWVKVPMAEGQNIPEPATWMAWMILAGGAAWSARRSRLARP